MRFPVVLKCLLDFGLTLVSVHVLEVFAFLVDCFAFKVAVAVVIIFFLEAFGAVLGIHGIDESGLFVVAEICQCSDVQSGHHVVVFVNQVVAVEHVESVPSGKGY